MKKSNTCVFSWIKPYLIIDRNSTQSDALCGRASRLQLNGYRNVALWLTLLLLGTLNGMARGDVTLLSADTSGVPGNGSSWFPSISADGRFVAFASHSDNLVPEDTNGFTDVFVKNVESGEIVRVSQDANGVEGTSFSFNPSISADGRFVAFNSPAINLVPQNTNAFSNNVFVKNLETGEIVRVSEDANGVEANDISRLPSISGDGRFVAFQSIASNLATEDTNGESDVFVKDLETGEIVRVSENARGEQTVSGEGSDGDNVFPSISADGHFVAFESRAINLLTGNTNDNSDVFVKNVVTGEIVRASEDAIGVPVNGFSVRPSISADGRFVAFESSVNNLVPGDADDISDGVFVKNVVTGEIIRVSEDAGGVQGNGISVRPSISADGRFVAFESSANNLVPGDTNEVIDVFVKNIVTGEIVSVSNGTYPGISADGRFVAFMLQRPEDISRRIFITEVFLADVVWPDAASLLLNLRYAVYSGTAAEVFWDRFIDNGEVLYEVTRNGELLGALDALSVFEDDLQQGMQYTYTVSVIDNNGNRLATDTIGFTTNNFEPRNPSAPENLTFSVYSSTAAELFWDRSTDDGLVIGYEVIRNNEFRGMLDVLSVFDDDLTLGVEYLYEITAVDNEGNRSATSSIRVTSGDPGTPGDGPGPPDGLRAVLYSSTAAELFWERADIPGLRYEIERDGAVLATTDGTSHFDDTLLPNVKLFEYSVVTIDANDRRSTATTITLGKDSISIPPRGTGIINSSNYLDVLSYVFDIYNGSADGYGQAILDLPRFSDERYSNPPELVSMEEGPPVPGPPENVTCSNGGTAVFTPLSGGFLEITEGWNAEFDNCQDGSTVFDGQLRRVASSSEFRESTDPLLVDAQIQQTHFSGSLDWKFTVSPGDLLFRIWNLADISYVALNNGETVFALSDATANLRIGSPVFRELSGGFSIRSSATGDHTLRVDIPDRLYLEIMDLDNDGFRDIETFNDPPRYEQGKMIVVAEDGSTLTLDADAGDPAVAEIILTNGDYRESSFRPWDFLAAEQMQPLRLPVPE